MSLLHKTTSWVVASLLAATSLYSEDQSTVQSNQTTRSRPQKSFEQGKKLSQNQMMPAYNAPLRTDVRGSWDLFAEGGFIYWQLSQDNMEVAFADTLPNTSYLVAPVQIRGSYVPMDFNFKPGFEVALGMNLDRDYWDSRAGYTRLHASNNASTDAVSLTGGGVAPLFPLWGNQVIAGSNVYNSISERWNCHLDIVDLDLGRSYYVGNCLTFRTAFGLKSAWILQNVRVTHTNTTFSNAILIQPEETPGTLLVIDRTHSWSIGPEAKLNTNWTVGEGFRLFGNATADVLYTKYKVQSKTSFVTTSTGAVESFISREKVSAIRPHVDLDLGFGWGSYFDNNNWHIDLSAAYGFQVFFSQNMFPRFDGSTAIAKQQLAAGNLYAQGLTATARLDF